MEALQFTWFLIVGFLLIGYFVLDGFDFGVGMALPFVSKDDVDRRVVINTIGPVWDLNETWLIVAGACLFASFPEWYATMFSGFYLALLLMLISLILRGVSFEYRHQGTHERWSRWFDRFIVIGSVTPALLWGVAFGNLIQGIPMRILEFGGWSFTGSLFDLLTPYPLLTGLTTLFLFFSYGLSYLALKSTGEVRERSRVLGRKVGLLTLLLAAAFIVWTVAMNINGELLWLVLVFGALAAASLIASLLSTHAGRDGWAFVWHLVTVVAAVGFIYFTLFPNLVVSATPGVENLTIWNGSSSYNTLVLMSWIAGFMLPVVLAYQAWTFWVFRKRVGREHIPGAEVSLGSRQRDLGKNQAVALKD